MKRYTIKRNFRKQGIFLDLFRKETLERLEERRVKEVQHFFELANAFFYYDCSLRERPDLSSGQQEALSIIWEKLEALLSSVGIDIIRKVDVDFDPRLYEAMEKVREGNGKPVVKQILQPGYVYQGNVIKPAKAIIEMENSESQE
jgi:molecular chaperone GrpE (heat shock protein)